MLNTRRKKGPFSTRTLGGGRYVLVIVDIYTTQPFVYIMKAKSEATQLIINLLSGDKETPPDAFVALAASAAIAVSDVPISALISEVRVARINGEYHVNPTATALEGPAGDVLCVRLELGDSLGCR